MENILNMHNTDLTFHRLGQTILACGRIRVMLSKSVKINIYKKKYCLLFITGVKLGLSYRGKECASRTGRRGMY